FVIVSLSLLYRLGCCFPEIDQKGGDGDSFNRSLGNGFTLSRQCCSIRCVRLDMKPGAMETGR
ncbi:hypothetical protein, partial [Shinella sp. G-2]|uniref:hypothetical protein n=1 Tax=Shinella sp. G-2 TaxID=3133141 RepID=UPI003D0227D5